MTLQKKLNIALVVLTAVGIILVVALVPNPGRAAVAVLAAGALSWFVTARIAHSRYVAALKGAAADLGLACLATSAEERQSEFLERMRKTSEADVFRWKVDGRLPVAIGTYHGFQVVVRVPVGLAFDAGAPDSTRVAAYHGVKMTGFTVYDRSRLKKVPPGKQAPTGDESFDSRFLVMAHRLEEAATVLTPEVRAAIVKAGDACFRGIEVNHYGVFLHEDGKVAQADLIADRVKLVVRMAEAARELGARA